MDFIERIKPGALASYEKYKILPSLVISQACLESGYGKSHIENNLFGIKATKSWKGKVATRKTREYVGGKWVEVTASFRAYDSFTASIEDHAKLLASNKRYAGVIGVQRYRDAAHAVHAAGYATDPLYAKKLISIIEKHNLQGLDKKALMHIVAISYKGKIDFVKGFYQDDWNYIPINYLRKLGFSVGWDPKSKTVLLSDIE